MLTIAGGIILGWIGIVAIRAMLAPSAPRYVPAPTMTPVAYDRAAEAEIRTATDPREARRRVEDVGLTVAVRSVSNGRSFAGEFDAFQRLDEREVNEALTRVVLTLYAADTMPALSWIDTKAELAKVADAELENRVRQWHDRRLGPYLNRGTVGFAHLSEHSSFRAFVVLADQWRTGSRALPPTWWG